MNWYYIDGPLRVGPHSDAEWDGLVNSGKITPDTLVWHEGLAKWTPYKEVTIQKEEEEEAELPPPLPTRRPETREAYIARILEEDYSVDTWGLIGRGWTLLRSNMGMLLGATFLWFALLLVGWKLPFLNLALAVALRGVVDGGLFNIYLRLLRGQHANISDLFAGFQSKCFGHLAMRTLISAILSLIALFPVGIAAGIMHIQPPSEQVMNDPAQFEVWLNSADLAPYAVLALVALACFTPVFYFAFCWMFAIPLIVDKRLRYWQAMQLSRRKVLQHPWKISIYLLVASIIVFAGALFIFGLLLAVPIAIGSLLYLYQDMFGDSTLLEDNQGQEHEETL